jgi:hypothetical protein
MAEYIFPRRAERWRSVNSRERTDKWPAAKQVSENVKSSI